MASELDQREMKLLSISLLSSGSGSGIGMSLSFWIWISTSTEFRGYSKDWNKNEDVPWQEVHSGRLLVLLGHWRVNYSPYYLWKDYDQAGYWMYDKLAGFWSPQLALICMSVCHFTCCVLAYGVQHHKEDLFFIRKRNSDVGTALCESEPAALHRTENNTLLHDQAHWFKT